jgi:hypothetical protein
MISPEWSTTVTVPMFSIGTDFATFITPKEAGDLDNAIALLSNDVVPVGEPFRIGSTLEGMGEPNQPMDNEFTLELGFSRTAQIIATGAQRVAHIELGALPAGTGTPELRFRYGPNDWRTVPGQRFQDGKLTASVRTYGYYQVFATVSSGQLRVGDIYVAPNPVTPANIAANERPTLFIEVGQINRAQYSVYNMRGDRVADGDVPMDVYFNNGKSFYKAPLDPSLSSGAYLIHVMIEKEGREKVRATRKFMVIK